MFDVFSNFTTNLHSFSMDCESLPHFLLRFLVSKTLCVLPFLMPV